MLTAPLESMEILGVIATPDDGFDATPDELAKAAFLLDELGLTYESGGVDLRACWITKEDERSKGVTFPAGSVVVFAEVTNTELLKRLDDDPDYADDYWAFVGQEAIPQLVDYVRKAFPPVVVEVPEPVAVDKVDEPEPVASDVSFLTAAMARLEKIAAAVTLQRPQEIHVNVPPPVIHVEQADNHIHVAAAPAPVVNVAAPVVNIEQPKPKSVEFERNGLGEILRAKVKP